MTEAINEGCFCSLPTSNIRDGEFVCVDDPKQVVFRARIYGTLEVLDPSMLVEDLQLWIDEGDKSLVVGSIRLNVDQKCPVAIKSFSDPECADTDESSGLPPTDMLSPSSESTTGTTVSMATEDTMATKDTMANVAYIVGAVIGVLLFVGCIVLLIIFLVCLMNRQADKRLE